MKKIVNRLIIQSVGLLIIFSLTIALLFGILFAKQTEDLHQEELLHRSELISTTMTEYFDTVPKTNQQTHQQGGMGGYGAFLRFLNDIAGENVWVVDQNLQPIINYHHQDTNLTSIPPKVVQPFVDSVYQTKKVSIEKERSFFQLEKISVVTPILVNQKVVGVVILQSKVSDIHKNQWGGYLLLVISLLVAAILASLLAWHLARKFVKPITAMRNYVNDLANEKYQEKLTISTKDELQELGDQLNILSDRLEEAKLAREKKERAEKDFLSKISHEIRTPIMVIKSSLEAINEGYLNQQEEKDYFEHLVKEVSALERLVNDLLELSRLESTEFKLQLTSIDPLDCINDALRSYRIPLKEKNQKVQLINTLTQRTLVNGDYLRMTQTLKILLDNAIKYSPEGSVLLLRLEVHEPFVQITLQNPIVKEETDVKELFDSFKRGKEITEPGTGLGLAIAKQVILRHDGEIQAASSNYTFTVTISLPIESFE